MSSVIIGYVNCRGLAEKIKGGDIFSICKERYDITVLTDAHCCLENESQWLCDWGYIGKFSSYSSRSRGVTVLFKNSFEFKINSEILYTNGHFFHFCYYNPRLQIDIGSHIFLSVITK